MRARSRETLAALAPVAQKLAGAEAQARTYGATLKERHGFRTLRDFAVVALGVERLVWRALTL